MIYNILTFSVIATAALFMVVIMSPLLSTKRYSKLYLIFSFLILVFQKTFTGIGINPIYMTELFLFVSLSFLYKMRGMSLIRGYGIYYCFFIVNFILLFPSIGLYGFESLRDSVYWIYAIFAFSTYVLVKERLIDIDNLYKRVFTYGLLYICIIYAAKVFLAYSSINILGLDLNFKGGDLAVFSIAAIFYALGARSRGSLENVIIFLMGILGIVLSFSGGSRNGIVAVTIVIGSAIVLANRYITTKFLISGILGICLVSSAAFMASSIGLINLSKNSSEITSIFVNDDSISTKTKEWRLSWWGDIINYTLFGKYLVAGKGFGINLATADGHQVAEDQSLRNPHSIHMTVLARTGILGSIVWLLLIGYLLIHSTLVFANLQNLSFMERRVFSTSYVFFLGTLINASFDVVIESPSGAYGFWMVCGLLTYFIRHIGSKNTHDKAKNNENIYIPQ